MSKVAVTKPGHSAARRPRRSVLGPILARLRGEPSRTWSIIITIYGDAIVPRGGCVWLGTLLAFFKALGIADGVVRTAMSRLAADGWLERHRHGRNSFYRLADKGRATFATAAEHIYAPRVPDFAGAFDLLLLPNGGDRDAARSALEAAGFGSPAPGLWVSPGYMVPKAAQDALRLTAGGDAAALRALAARSWPLEATADAYGRFIATFTPVAAALDADVAVDDLEALVARVLLIHEYRRVVLRDPILPAAALPPDWPGAPARALCARLYRKLIAPSERWLDRHAVDENGAGLPANTDLARRFQP
jgi:phenylacetic acid degradation operon negative regulatory protein